MVQERAAGRKGIPAWVVLGAAMCLAATLNLWVGRHYTFFGDDWSFLLYRRPWTLSVFLAPHNEHASLVPVLVYKVIYLTGTSLYTPYLFATQVGVAAASAAMYMLMRRHIDAIPALLAAVSLLFFGAGADDYLWAFQLSLTWGAALGLWALVLVDWEPVDRLRGAVAAGLLILCLFSSGVGLFYWVSCAIRLGLSRSRAALLILVPSAALYGAWYLTLGRSHTRPSLALASELSFVLSGLGAAGGAQLLGGRLSGLPLAFGLACLVGWGLWRYRQPIWPALTAGLVSEFILIAFVRSDLGAAQATASRYLWIAGTFTAPFWAAAIAALWRVPVRRVAALAMVVAFVVGGALSYRHIALYRYGLLKTQAHNPAKFGAPRDLRLP